RLLAHPHVVAVHEDERRAFRSDALRYHQWLEETPRMWATVGADELDSWMHGVYCTSLQPPKRLLWLIARLLAPTWAWKAFVALLPADLQSERRARRLRSIACARAAY